MSFAVMNENRKTTEKTKLYHFGNQTEVVQIDHGPEKGYVETAFPLVGFAGVVDTELVGPVCEECFRRCSFHPTRNFLREEDLVSSYSFK